MTLLVRRFIKTGIGFLAAGLLLGLYILVRRELFGSWPAEPTSCPHIPMPCLSAA